MRYLIATLFFICSCVQTWAQNCDSSWLKLDQKATDGSVNRVFNIGGKDRLVVNGWCEVDKNDTVYSEFVLFECGSERNLGEWSALDPSRIRQLRDTLIVEDLDWLPVGKDFKYEYVTLFVNKYYCGKEGAKVIKTLSNSYRKYTRAQIEHVYKEYSMLTKGNFERNIEVADMLLWAYVSGDAKAEEYFRTIESKFGPFDGAIAESWHDALAIFERYKAMN